MKNVITSFVVAAILTAASYLTGLLAGWIAEVNYLEAFSVFTSYSCTWLCVKQSRHNYPIGAVSVAALSLLFYQTGLYASMLLNVYLIPTLIWGWFRWRPDPITRPVTRVAMKWWPVYLGAAVATWWVLVEMSMYMGSPLPRADSFILAASILAQFLLDQKKIETWAVWFVVNVVAIGTYWEAGLVLVAMQFVFFLMNTVYGYVSWKSTMVADDNMEYVR